MEVADLEDDARSDWGRARHRAGLALRGSRSNNEAIKYCVGNRLRDAVSVLQLISVRDSRGQFLGDHGRERPEELLRSPIPFDQIRAILHDPIIAYGFGPSLTLTVAG